ncbi:MAG: hypothetical protein ACOZNI_05695 [Myxococcota bacterium]
MLALVCVATAASVAVLDFDGYGVSRDDALAASQALRDRFLAEGLLDPLSGSDIAGGVSRGEDAALRRARELVASARSKLDAGDVAGAIGALAEGISLHERAWSDVGRRSELADAHWLYAQALLRGGRSAEARAHATEACFLHPRYGRDRATNLTSAQADLLRTAEDTLAKGPRRVRPSAEIAEIAASLEVDFVVTGFVEHDGQVHTRLYAGARLLGEAVATLDQLPPLADDPAWADVALELAGAAGAAPEEGGEDEDLDEALEDLDDIGDLDAPAPRAEPARAPPARRPPGERVTDQWWFWTGAFFAAGGVGALVGYAVWEPGTEVVEEPDVWTVRVEVE